MNRWKVKLPKAGHGDGAEILLDGDDVTADFKHITIEAGVGQPTEVTVVFSRNVVDVEFETEPDRFGRGA